tara:strand:+ start:93 stop:449 length:357 start_codon:yes stop_codon:yes gene_type:complete
MNSTAVITVDGQELVSVPGTVNFKPGLFTAKARTGPRGYAGAGVVPNNSTLQCDVHALTGYDPTGLSKGKEMTVRVSDVVNGDEWVVPVMVLVEDPEFGDGDEAKWSLSLEGATAEKV